MEAACPAAGRRTPYKKRRWAAAVVVGRIVAGVVEVSGATGADRGRCGRSARWVLLAGGHSP